VHASRSAAASIVTVFLSACLEQDGSSKGRAGTDDSSGRAAIVVALDEPDALRRAARLSEALEGLPADETGAIRDLMMGDPARELGDVESLLLLEAWSRHEPRDAGEWALRKAPVTHRGAAVAIGIRAWAQSHPEEVVREVRVTGAYASDPHVVTALVRGWFDSGQPGIETYLRDLGQGFEQQRAIAILTRERIRRDGTGAAMRWAEQTSAEGSERFKLALVRQV
jgi:hypothetical protein